MISLRRIALISLAVVALPAALMAAEGDPPVLRLKALIVDGQNNHPWKETTPVLEGILKSCGRFDVEIATSPPKGKPMGSFKPVFKDFDVIVLNYNGADWPEPTRKAFVAYVRGGGGVVVFHAANNSFPKWPEFNEIIGVGGWGGRNEKSGPLVRWRDGKVVYENKPGRAGSHPKQHEFQVVTRNREHPIVAGLPEKWMHVADELYADLRGPAKNLDLLATSYSNPKMRNGTGEHEPALFTIRFGEGRVFHTILGHAGKQMQSVGFIVTLQRGAEWAATGNVTLTDVPKDFPTADKVSSRSLDSLGVKAPAPSPTDEDTPRIADPFAVLTTYKNGADRAALAQIEGDLRGAKPKKVHEIEAKLIGVLEDPKATVPAKDFACRILRRIGGVRSVPALAKLLPDEKLSHMARYALQNMPGPAAAKVLQDALGTISDSLKVGVVSSLAARGDRTAVDAIVPLLASENTDLRRAAISALGTLGGESAATAVEKADAPDTLRQVWLDARLKCADSLVTEDKQDAALATYRELRGDGYPAAVRVAAVRGHVSAGDKDGVDLLCSLLRSEDAKLRRSAGALIAALPAGPATERLAAQMPSLEPDAQLLLVSAFATRGDKASAPVVAGAALSESTEVREAALRALTTVGGAEHVPLLLKAAVGDGTDAAIARETLVKLSAPDVDEALLEAAKAEAEPATRAAAIFALVARGNAAALPVYLAAARDANEGVRLAALKGLAAFAGPEQAEELVAMLLAGPSAAESALLESAIAKSAEADGGAAAVAAIAAAIKTAKAAARGALLTALGRIGGEDALALVRGDLKSDDADVVKAAIRAMSQWKDTGPLPDLLAIVKSDADLISQVLAFRGYIDLLVNVPSADPGAQVDALTEAMSLAPRADEKKLVLSVLPKAPSRATLAIAEACLTDAELAKEARAAVAQIKPLLDGIFVLDEELTLPAKKAKIHGEAKGAVYEPAPNRDCIGVWKSVDTFVTWNLEALAGGEFNVAVSQSMDKHAGAEYVVEVAGQKLPGVVKDTGDWAKFVTFEIGKITLPSAGVYELAFRVTKKPKQYVANLRSVTLIKVNGE